MTSTLDGKHNGAASAGAQEVATILKDYVVTLSDLNAVWTDRPEALQAFLQLIAGTSAELPPAVAALLVQKHGRFSVAAGFAANMLHALAGSEPRSVGLRHAAIAAALAKEAKKGNEFLRVSGISEHLEKELHQRLKTLASAVVWGMGPGGSTGSSYEADPPVEGDLFMWDERLARIAEDIGEHGKAFARELRVNAAKRLTAYQQDESRPVELLRLWYPAEDESGGGAPRFAVSLAQLLWRDVVHPKTEESPTPPTSAMTRAVLVASLDTYHSRDSMPRLQTLGLSVHRLPDGTEVEAVDPEHRDKLIKRLVETGPVTDSVILEALADKAVATRSMTGQLLMRHLFDVGYRQKVVEKLADFRTYTVQGGLTELLVHLDRTSKGEERDLLRRALDGYELIRVPLANSGFDGLLSWSERKAAPRRKAEVQIIMKDPLLPGYVHSLPSRTLSQKEARVLIPIPGRLPPLTGHHATYGAKMLLQMLTLESLAMGRQDYAEVGVRLPERVWSRMADRVQLGRAQAREAREAFVAGTNDVPPFLIQLPDDRFRLAPAHHDAERVILEGAKLSAAKGGVRRRTEGAKVRINKTKR